MSERSVLCAVWDAEIAVQQARRDAGETLRAMRERLGVGLNELARELDADPSHLSKVERGVAWNQGLVSHMEFWLKRHAENVAQTLI